MTQSGTVGAWDSGPFDNDDAADFAGELDDADPNQRLVLIRDALQAAADGDVGDEPDGDVDLTFARGVAAAAVIAANRIDTAPIDSSYAPKFLRTGDPVTVPDDLIELAVLALDTLADTDGSEYAELFGESGTIEALRTALTT